MLIQRQLALLTLWREKGGNKRRVVNHPRPPWDRTWMDVVAVMARRGTCVRRQIGAVIISEDNRFLAEGYNGVASGQPHCRDGQHCEASHAPSGMALDGCDAVHSEINALVSCSEISRAHTIYVSAEPCIDCVKAMLNTPILHVVYAEQYARSGRNLWLKRNVRYNFPYTWKQLLLGEDVPRD